VSGLGTAYGTLHWIFEVPGFRLHHSLVAACYLALYLACWCVGVSLLARTAGTLAVPAACLWVLLDYIRAHAGFLAFPWGTLAQTQHRNLPLLQIATLTGEYGVTFIVALFSAALAGIILHRAWRVAIFVALLVALAHIGGRVVLKAANSDPSIRVAVVQPNIQRGEQATEEGHAATFKRLERLTRTAALEHPSLIAWPETAIAGNLQANPLLAADVQTLAQEVRAPIILGVSEMEKFAARDATGLSRRRTYNSAYLVTPGEPLLPPYRKRLLVPFGEYVPLEMILPWPAWMGGRGFDSEPGNESRLFTLPDGTPFAVMICWESLFSDLSRESVREGARLLVQLNNPVWFGQTAAAKQQNISSVFRAVENRVPVLLSSNTGPSQIIDRYGRVIAGGSEVFTAGIVTGDVELGSGETSYTQVGNLFICAALFTLGGEVYRRRHCVFQ
jgi:apolipoprotein N-acyltransferase